LTATGERNNDTEDELNDDDSYCNDGDSYRNNNDDNRTVTKTSDLTFLMCYVLFRYEIFSFLKKERDKEMRAMDEEKW